MNEIAISKLCTPETSIKWFATFCSLQEFTELRTIDPTTIDVLFEASPVF